MAAYFFKSSKELSHSNLFFFLIFYVCMYLFIYFGCARSSLQHAGSSLQHAGSLVVVCGLLVVACMRDLVPDQGLNRAPCTGSAESYPLDPREVPLIPVLCNIIIMGQTSHHLCHFPLVRSQSQFLHSRRCVGQGFTQVGTHCCDYIVFIDHNILNRHFTEVVDLLEPTQ